MNDILIYCGAGIIMLWGIAHIIPTKAILNGFGTISADNRKVLSMGIIAEGLFLIFLGVLPLVAVLTGNSANNAANYIVIACAVMIFILAVLTLVTGAQTKTTWYKFCPAVKILVFILYILGAVS